MSAGLDRVARLSAGAALDGFVHPDFAPVARTLGRQIATHRGGAAVCVYHRGECVVDLWGGSRDGAGRPWRRETMAASFSTTKGVASTLVHIMADRGLIDYDAPVADYWPGFARAGKQAITVRQVLAHQSGLYHIRQMVDDAHRMLDWDYMVAAIEATPPIHPPGERTGYHGLTYGFLVGEILQRVTGRRFSELVREELAEPLGLEGFHVGAPKEALLDAADLLWPQRPAWVPRLPRLGGRRSAWPDAGELGERVTEGLRQTARVLGVEFDIASLVDALAPRGISHFQFDAAETLRVAIPAANGLFTARSLARMYAALAEGGSLDGVRLLSRETLERACEVQTAPGALAVLPFDMRWRLGYHVIPTTRGVPRHAFGHFGFGGSGGWADPSRRLSVALIVNAGLGTPFGDMRTARMGATALGCADRRR